MSIVTVSVNPKGGTIRNEELMTERTATLSPFLFEEEDGKLEPRRFINPHSGEEGGLTIGDSIQFDLSKRVDAHNYKTLKEFMVAEPGLFSFIIDDQEEKDALEVALAERKHDVVGKLRVVKEDLSTLKAIYRRVTGFMLSGVGDQSIYAKLVQLASTDTDKFFVNNVFVSESKHFVEFKFIDDLVESGLLSYENGLVRDSHQTIVGDSLEAVRYRFETDTRMRSEYEQLLSFKRENKGIVHSVVLPEAKEGSVKIDTVIETTSAVGSVHEDALIFGARAILTKVDTSDTKALIRECVEAGLVLKDEDSDVDGGFAYKLSIMGTPYSHEQLVTHISNSPQLYNDFKEILEKEKAMV